MWNEPTADELARLPPLYATEGTPWTDTVIHMHFFLGSCDWFVAEYCPERRLFFGFASLGDAGNAEWGYVGLDELRAISVQGFRVDRDLHWVPRAASRVKLILGDSGRASPDGDARDDARDGSPDGSPAGRAPRRRSASRAPDGSPRTE